MTRLYIGVLSGTSMDGIDVAVVQFEPALHVVAAATLPFPAPLPQPLHTLDDDQIRALDAQLGEAFGQAVRTVLLDAEVPTNQIAAIGSHGQTIRHQPPISLQIGCPQRIADITSLTTVANFRAADLAAGGQGAPLAPLLHHALLSDANESRAVINLGGIANITLLPRAGAGPVQGWDTGPANCLLDLWHRRHASGPFDDNGQRAGRGQVQHALLDRLLSDDYFAAPPPKSTGPDYFSAAWLDAHLAACAAAQRGSIDDVQATLSELTAITVARALKSVPTALRPQRAILCGGGCHNADLMARLRRHWPDGVLCHSDQFGLNVDAVEAVLFAWLARERLANREQDTRHITGAAEAVLLGEVSAPRARRESSAASNPGATSDK